MKCQICYEHFDLDELKDHTHTEAQLELRRENTALLSQVEQYMAHITKLREALQELHDECCVLPNGKRLNRGDMLEPSVQTVLKARALLEGEEG